MSLFISGSVAPQDPLTGAIVGKPWIGDKVGQVDYSLDGGPTEHTLQSGSIVADAIQARPGRLRVEFTLTDGGSFPHLIPAFRGRADMLARALLTIRAKRCPVRLWIRGFPPLRDYAFGPVQQSGPEDLRVVRVSCEFVAMEFASLVEIPLAVDADLLAAGMVSP